MGGDETLNDGGGVQMVVVLTIKEMNYVVVGLFYNFVGLFRIYICDIKSFGYTVCLNAAIV